MEELRQELLNWLKAFKKFGLTLDEVIEMLEEEMD